MKRRVFIQKIASAALFAQLPFWVKCSIPNENKVEKYINNLPQHKPLSEIQAKNCVIVQQTLFPDVESTPGSIALNSFPFFISVINDNWRDEAENEFLIVGLDALNNLSHDIYDSDFYALNVKKQQEILANYINDDGEDWASAMLSVIFESLFANPVYGCNPNGIGWKWLQYTPGQPQPTIENKYPEIIKKRKSESAVISNINQILNS
jgi:gluconate 2-dehydrogenase gamma chain